MFRLSLALLAFAQASAFGFIVENTNRWNRTYYYEVNGDELRLKACSRGPSTGLNVEDECGRTRYRPIKLAKFKELLEKASEPKQKELAAQVKELQRRKVTPSAELARVEALLSPPASFNDPLRPDYLRRRDDLTAILADLDRQEKSAQSQIDGLQSLFGNNGLIEQGIPHPIRQGGEDYFVVRPYIPLMASVFAKVDGPRFGGDTWWDASTGYLWATRCDYGDWDEANAACSGTWTLASQYTLYTIRELREAFLAGETAMTCKNDYFTSAWGAAMSWRGGPYSSAGMTWASGYRNGSVQATEIRNRLGVICVSKEPRGETRD